MAIKPLLVFRNADSTADLNSRAARILDRGIFDGGQLSPSGVAVTVDVAPFIAVGFDGMVAISDGTETLSVPVPAAGTEVSYLILHLEYRSLTASIANLQLIPETTWLTSVSKNFFITFAKFDVGSAATALANDPNVTIDYSVGDWAEKAGKAGWRAPVADAASLPDPTAVETGPNLGNRDGDVRLTLDTNTLFAWNETAGAWGAVGGALDLREAVARADEFENQVLRSWNGSGLVGTTNNDSASDGRNKNVKDGVDWALQSALANRIDVAPIHAVVNGHFVKTEYTELTLTAPGALRFDCIYLEVWRETIATDVASETYPNDPTAGGTSTFAQLRVHLETLLEQRTTPNIGFSKIEIIDATTIVATRWRITSVAGVSTLSINDPLAAAITALNIDSNPFTTLGAQNDPRIWRSTAPSAFDGISWAIPLMIIRRTLSEAGPTSFIEEFRSDDANNRYVYDIAPRAEGGMGLVEVTQGVEFGEGPRRSFSDATQLPSGWLGGFDESIFSDTPGTINIPRSSFRLLGRVIGAGVGLTSVTLPAAPASGRRRDLVYAEVQGTTHFPGVFEYSGPQETARYDRQGLRTRTWIGRILVADAAAADTEAGAMAAAGFTINTEDPVAWTRTPTDNEDNSLGVVWGVPIALIHRRNTLAYDPTTADGRNGADRSGLPGLPDNSAEQPYDYEILDLRRRVVHTDGEMNMILAESFDKLLRGELRTKFGADGFDPGTGIRGTQILQVDRIFSGATGGGYFSPTPNPDDRTGVWTESDEAEVFGWNFKNPGVLNVDPTGVFSWNGGFPAGQLTITAPPGHHLSFDQDHALEGNAPPAGVSLVINEEAAATTERLLRSGVFSFPPFSTATDAAGNLTSVVWDVTLPGTITPASATVYLQTWAVRPNRSTDAIYSTNESLFAVPDIVHRADLGGTTRVNIGPILKTLSVVITADLFGAGRHGTVVDATILGAAFPELGAGIRMYGLSNVHLRGASIIDSGSKNSLAFVRLTDGAAGLGLLEMEIEFTSLTTATVAEVTIMCDGDSLNQWIEITAGSKQVRGMYSYAYADIDFVGGTVLQPGAAPTSEHGNSTAFATVVPFSEVGLEPQGISAFADFGANLVIDNAQCIAYTTLAGSYEFWTDPANLPTGWFGAPTLTASSYFDAAAVAVNTGGGYNPYFSLDSPAHGGNPDLRVIGVQKRPLLVADDLRVFYLYTPYQGITSNLGDWLQGPVQSVGDQHLITAGVGLPHMHPRRVAMSRLGLPPYAVRYSTDGAGSGSAVADIGFPSSTGISFDNLYLAGRTDWVRPDTEGTKVRPTDSNMFAASSRLPYPFTPSVPGFPFVDENRLDYRAILTGTDSFDELNKGLVHLSVLDAVAIPAASPWVFEDDATFPGDYIWRSQASGRFLAFHLRLPAGSSITGVWVDVASTGPSGSVTATVHRRDKTASSGRTLTAALLSGIVPITTATTYKGQVAAVGMYPTSVTVASDDEYWVLLNPSTSNLKVYGITVGVLAVGDQVTNRTVVRTSSRQGMFVDTVAEPLGPTSVFEEPAASALFADLETIWVSDGKIDYGSAPPRGRTLSVDIGSSVIYGFDFYGYVVGSDGLTRDERILNFNGSVVGNFRTGAPDMPKGYTTGMPSFVTLEDVSNSSYAGGILSAVPYLVRNATNEVVMGVSVGAGLTANKLIFPGSTVDAFYPAGRPVFRRGYGTV